jgi:diguanylate cyclase (GGDEF)-like protein
VLMIDIDNFKRFNDTFGHPVGDAALIAVARALTGALHRAGDVLARYGGEEFAVVMPGVDAEGAITVANQMVQTVRAVRLRQAPGWNASVSIGAATWLPGAEVAKSGDLLALADTALYAAKAAGKDRAHPAQQPAPDPAVVTGDRASKEDAGAG